MVFWACSGGTVRMGLSECVVVLCGGETDDDEL